MLQKIKNLVKKITVVEWIVLGVSILALVFGVVNFQGGKHKGQHGGNKHGGEAAVQVVPASK